MGRAPGLLYSPCVPGSRRCSPQTQGTVPVEVRVTTLSVVRQFLRRFTPSGRVPSVAPVAAKMTSSWGELLEPVDAVQIGDAPCGGALALGAIRRSNNRR